MASAVARQVSRSPSSPVAQSEVGVLVSAFTAAFAPGCFVKPRRQRLSACRSDNLPRMGQAIGQFLPLAIGVALSPVPIIVVIAILFSPHATPNGPTYLLGWVIAVGVVAGIALATSDVASVG
jgi:hypothetical protein